MDSPIAIAGASGYIGGRLAPRLLQLGYRVRCLARFPRKIEERGWAKDPRAEVRPADWRHLEGCATAYYLIHSMVSAGAEYAQRDRQLAAEFARAARQAGVERIVYLGGLGETGAGLSRHLASRREVEAALASAGVPVTVLRAAMIIGSGSASFEILRYLVERLPVMVTPKWVSTPCQPIAVRNVLGYLTGVLERPDTAGQVYDIGGPDVMCYRDIMQVMAEELGLRRRWILAVPVLTPTLSSYWIHLVTPLTHDIAPPGRGPEEPGDLPGSQDQGDRSAGFAIHPGGDPGGAEQGGQPRGRDELVDGRPDSRRSGLGGRHSFP